MTRTRRAVLLASTLAIAIPARVHPEGPPGATGWIDTHVHLGGPLSAGGGGKGVGRGAGSPGADCAAAAESLVRMMDARGIGKCLIVTVPARGPSARSDVNEKVHEGIVEAVKRHSGRLFLMDGGATLQPIAASTAPSAVTPAIRADFEKRAKAILDGGAIGFGEMILLHFCLGPTHSYQYTPPDHPLMLALADLAASRDVPIDVHMEAWPSETAPPENLRSACSQNPDRFPASLPAFERLLQHNRKARIVWQHVGWDNGGFMTPALMRDLLGKHPNLYLSLRVERRTQQVAAASAMPNRIVDASGAIREEWLALFHQFPDRFVIGCDEFVGPKGGLTTEPHASFETTWSMLDRLPPEVKAKIGRDNAAKIYGLGK